MLSILMYKSPVLYDDETAITAAVCDIVLFKLKVTPFAPVVVPLGVTDHMLLPPDTPENNLRTPANCRAGFESPNNLKYSVDLY